MSGRSPRYQGRRDSPHGGQLDPRQLTGIITKSVGDELIALFQERGQEMNEIHIATMWNRLASQRWPPPGLARRHGAVVDALLRQTLDSALQTRLRATPYPAAQLQPSPRRTEWPQVLPHPMARLQVPPHPTAQLRASPNPTVRLWTRRWLPPCSVAAAGVGLGAVAVDAAVDVGAHGVAGARAARARTTRRTPVTNAPPLPIRRRPC